MKGFSVTGNMNNDIIELAKFNGKNPDRMPPGMPIVLGLRIKLGMPLIVHVLTEAVCKKSSKSENRNSSIRIPGISKKTIFYRS